MKAEESENVESYFTELIKSYVNFPDNLKIEWKEAKRMSLLIVQPDPYDYGMLAGQKGRNFLALQVIVAAVAAHRNKPIQLALTEDLSATNRPRVKVPYSADPNWQPQLIRPLLSKTLRLSGMGHLKVSMQKASRAQDNDETFYAISGVCNEADEIYANALGQLMEAIGAAQGQRLEPKQALAEKSA